MGPLNLNAVFKYLTVKPDREIIITPVEKLPTLQGNGFCIHFLAMLLLLSLSLSGNGLKQKSDTHFEQRRYRYRSVETGRETWA